MDFNCKGLDLKRFVDNIPGCYVKPTNQQSNSVTQFTLYTRGRTAWSPTAKKWGVIQIYKQQLNVQLDYPFGAFEEELLAQKLGLPRRKRSERGVTGLCTWRGKSFETARIILAQDEANCAAIETPFTEFLTDLVGVSCR